MTPHEAETAIHAHAARMPAENLPLTELVGTVLQQRVVATRDQPPFDRVTMDGISFASSAVAAGRRAFRIAGIQAAGAAPATLPSDAHPSTNSGPTDYCLEAMTGAMLPHGCDCVVPVERIRVENGVATLEADLKVTPRMNVHARGLDSRAGTLLLAAGTRLGPPEVAVIASTGLSHVSVSRQPRIAVISTGDELREPGEPVSDWQIYRSNAYAVVAALQRRGFAQLTHAHMPDDRGILLDRLQAQLQANDVLVLSGGVSMGRFDYVPQVLAELGIQTIFHKVEQRPGRPMWFGAGGGKTVYALPGNPVSTLVCLTRYVFPGLDAARGAPAAAAEAVTLAAPAETKPALTVFTPVKLVRDGTGRALAEPCPTRGSGDFVSLIGTDGFVELPPGDGQHPTGSVVNLYRW